MRLWTALGALLLSPFAVTAVPAAATGPEGCYEAQAPSGRKYEVKLTRLHSDPDVGTIYDVHVRIDGKTARHRHALMSAGTEGECALELPEAELGQDEFFYFGIGVMTIANEPVTPEACNLGTIDLTRQLTGEGDDYDNYIEFGVNDAFTQEPVPEKTALLRRPIPKDCRW